MSEITVYMVASSAEEAKHIAETLVRERLAACANYLGKMTSFYWWDGDVQNGAEHAVLFKTTKDLFKLLETRVLELHSYDCPCVISWDIQDGSPAYLDWIRSETRP